MRRKLNPEQQAKSEARKATFRKLAGDLGRMTTEQRGTLAASLPAIATVEGRTISPFNQCLIASQCPTATLVGGFQQWKRAGRIVRKGEHGLSIWVPAGARKTDGSQDDDVFFLMGTVFDVSQTDAVELEQVAA